MKPLWEYRLHLEPGSYVASDAAKASFGQIDNRNVYCGVVNVDMATSGITSNTHQQQQVW